MFRESRYFIMGVTPKDLSNESSTGISDLKILLGKFLIQSDLLRFFLP